jgi:hypothetical protein
MFYSKQTGGFYSREIHGDNIPADAVEITADEHAALINGQSNGKRIVSDESGKPYLADPAPLSDAELLDKHQAEASEYLSSTDWYFARLAETGQEVPDEIKQKRADARAVLNEESL